MRERGKVDSVTTAVPRSMLTLPLFCHERRICEGGNRTAWELSHGEKRRASNLSSPVRPADPSPNHVAVREAISVAAAGGRHRSHRSTSVILLFTIVAEPLKLLAAIGAAAG
ncbi:uncharacterized protein LOC110268827 [Arachis ipaensis]|uniref:uncharacterized protein LOC110268827 n=1 Tax=Arachis ipaensis TaxID=130454 RepID=UPI000A2B5BE6|nr:uncharacterized protein LOC110268827 [Arachis ipaensis]QHO23966.1 uncharacterized protein DS421_12g368200 [Arachis hypogaea]